MVGHITNIPCHSSQNNSGLLDGMEILFPNTAYRELKTMNSNKISMTIKQIMEQNISEKIKRFSNSGG